MKTAVVTSLRLVYDTYTNLGARRGGGGKSRHSPPLENKKNIGLFGGSFCYYFLGVGAFLLRFSPYGGPFFTMWGLSATFFSIWGTFFVLMGGGGLSPPPLQKFLLAPTYRDFYIQLEQILHKLIHTKLWIE